MAAYNPTYVLLSIGLRPEGMPLASQKHEIFLKQHWRIFIPFVPIDLFFFFCPLLIKHSIVMEFVSSKHED